VHAIDDASVTTTRHTGPVRHSSAGGINLQAERGGSAAYLNDVLTRIVNGHPNSEIDRLLPWAYRRQDLKAVA
jgi:hypothetical protein